MLERSDLDAERYLRIRLQMLAQALARCGIPPDEIAAQWIAFENTVRAERARLSRAPRPEDAA
jgi:hypothetical protein